MRRWRLLIGGGATITVAGGDGGRVDNEDDGSVDSIVVMLFDIVMLSRW